MADHLGMSLILRPDIRNNDHKMCLVANMTNVQRKGRRAMNQAERRDRGMAYISDEQIMEEQKA